MSCSRAKLFYSHGVITDGARVCMCVSSVSRFDRLKPHSVHTCATAILYVFPSCPDFCCCGLQFSRGEGESIACWIWIEQVTND